MENKKSGQLKILIILSILSIILFFQISIILAGETNKITSTCKKNSDCKTNYCDSFGKTYCKGNNTYHKQNCYTFECLKKSCVSKSNLKETLVETCANGCSNGACIDNSNNNIVPLSGSNPIIDCSSADINHDGSVNGADLNTILSKYNTVNCSDTNSWCNSSDINHDTFVNGADLNTVLSYYNQVCINHLIFYESFDNQSSILNNQGNSSVGIYNFTSGIKGNAIDLTNQFFGMYILDNYITYPTNIKFKQGSINFWVKVPKNIYYYRYGAYYYNWFDTSKGFFDTGRTGSSNSLGIFSSNGNTVNYPNMSTAYTELGTYSGYAQASAVINLSDYGWHYISVNWVCNNNSNDYLVIFVDGIDNPYKSIFSNGCNFSGTDTNDFWIGKNNAYTISNSYFDEFKIFDSPKNYTEVKADYKSYIGTCLLNSECGTNGLIGNSFCSNNSVYRNYITYSCNNPGLYNLSYCSNATSQQLIQTCQYGCSVGHCNTLPVKNISTGSVKIIGRNLVVDGKNYTVKSVGYAPVPIGYSADYGYDVTVHPELRARDFPLLRNMSVNTIRTWGKVGQASFLDDAWNNGTKPIRVIMGYWMGNNLDYTNVTVRNQIKSDFNSYVSTYKNNPAVLIWAIGNEENHFYANGDNAKLAAYFSLVNEMAQNAYAIEGANYHPVMAIALEFPGTMTTVGNTAGGADDSSIPYIDMWGINHYPGSTFGNFFDTYDSKTSKPLIVTEYGIDALNNSNLAEYESTQASWEVNLWREIKSRAVGGSLMEYSDEWFKDYSGNINTHDYGGYATSSHPDGYSNEEWWGIMRTVKNNSSGIDIMQPRQAYYDLGNEFKN